MPELPEVETTCLGLSKALLGARIIRADLDVAHLREVLLQAVYLIYLRMMGLFFRGRIYI